MLFVKVINVITVAIFSSVYFFFIIIVKNKKKINLIKYVNKYNVHVLTYSSV